MTRSSLPPDLLLYSIVSFAYINSFAKCRDILGMDVSPELFGTM